jgi:hypothetical protein
MIYQLVGHGWPVNGGATLIPQGTRIDTGQPEWEWLAEQVPPPNAQALDQNAYDVMIKYYLPNIILTGEGVNRWGDPLG